MKNFIHCGWTKWLAKDGVSIMRIGPDGSIWRNDERWHPPIALSLATEIKNLVKQNEIQASK